MDNLHATEKLFLVPTRKDGIEATRHQEQLLGLVELHKDEVKNHIHMGRMSAHGLRKDSAACSTSGRTSPPPTPSIDRQGKWSMGKVLDVY